MRGTAIKYGDNIDTDVIIPARYLTISDIRELAKYCMIDLDKEFINRVKPGDIMVAGKNFGSGSSREHAPAVIKASGISCIIAETFARIFYRNAINIGLPIIESIQGARDIRDGDQVSVDFKKGTIINKTQNKVYKGTPFPQFMHDLMEAGGLINYVREKEVKL